MKCENHKCPIRANCMLAEGKIKNASFAVFTPCTYSIVFGKSYLGKCMSFIDLAERVICNAFGMDYQLTKSLRNQKR